MSRRGIACLGLWTFTALGMTARPACRKRAAALGMFGYHLPRAQARAQTGTCARARRCLAYETEEDLYIF